MKYKYDYLIVGSGLFGSIFAHECTKRGKKVLVIDKRGHIGGNIYTEEMHGINVHKYGAHIFHTSKKDIWDYVNQFAEFNNYINSPIAIFEGEVYNLPFNMNTFVKMWGITSPDEARDIINKQVREHGSENPKNLEEQAISLVGKDIYEKLIKGYTEKQWGRDCKELPAFIIRRLPVRFTYNNNYFNDRYQGIPLGGYTKIIEKLLEGSDLILNADYFDYILDNERVWNKVLFTGSIDRFFEYSLGNLEYRSLEFEEKKLEKSNFQGNAVVNYTSKDIRYNRIIEHKHFEFGNQPLTIVSYEYSVPWEVGREEFYPVNDKKNNALYAKYRELAREKKDVIFGGRLGDYQYYDMDKVCEKALELAALELKKE